MHLLQSLLLFGIISYGQSLHCWTCTYSHLDSSNPLLSTVLTIFRKISNEDCRLKDPDQNQYNLDFRECEKPESGKRAMCADIEGTVHGKLYGLSVEYLTIERGCVIVDEDDEKYSPGVHDKLPSYGPVRSLFDKTLADTDIAQVDFDGTVTYRTQSTATEIEGVLRCYKCSWYKWDIDNKVLQLFVDAIALLSSDACRLDEDGDSSDGDKYNVDIRNCVPPSDKANYINKCARASGTVTGTYLGIDVAYTTLQRNCAVVPKEDSSMFEPVMAAAYTDGCHSASAASASDDKPLYSLIQGSAPDVSGYSMNEFEGDACYYTMSEGVGSASHVCVSWAVVILLCLANLVLMIF